MAFNDSDWNAYSSVGHGEQCTGYATWNSNEGITTSKPGQLIAAILDDSSILDRHRQRAFGLIRELGFEQAMLLLIAENGRVVPIARQNTMNLSRELQNASDQGQDLPVQQASYEPRGSDNGWHAYESLDKASNDPSWTDVQQPRRSSVPSTPSSISEDTLRSRETPGAMRRSVRSLTSNNHGRRNAENKRVTGALQQVNAIQDMLLLPTTPLPRRGSLTARNRTRRGMHPFSSTHNQILNITKCPLCGSELQRGFDMERHFDEVCLPIRYYGCADEHECGRKWVTRQDVMEKHLFVKHGVINTNDFILVQVALIKACGFCGIVVNAAAFRAHVEVHLKEHGLRWHHSTVISAHLEVLRGTPLESVLRDEFPHGIPPIDESTHWRSKAIFKEIRRRFELEIATAADIQGAAQLYRSSLSTASDLGSIAARTAGVSLSSNVGFDGIANYQTFQDLHPNARTAHLTAYADSSENQPLPHMVDAPQLPLLHPYGDTTQDFVSNSQRGESAVHCGGYSASEAEERTANHDIYLDGLTGHFDGFQDYDFNNQSQDPWNAMQSQYNGYSRQWQGSSRPP